jgi:hypothetical protein
MKLKRTLLGLGGAILAITATIIAAPASSAQVLARPDFELPFPCGEVWNGATYQGHGGDNYFPLDFNWGFGDDDLGKPVVASAAGTVQWGADGVITINHGGGWASEYRHMVHRVAADGAQVVQGQLIGNVGEVGDASGPHLHYAQVLNGQEQHIVLHGESVTYSFEYNGPPYTSYNCGNSTSNSAAESTNGDKYDDLLAVDPNNVMQVYHGTANGTFTSPTALGGGWSSSYNRIAVGDSNADGSADILATSTDGKLHYWHNSGSESFTKLANAGVGWTSIEWFSLADVNGDDKSDILARDGGILYWYPGEGSGNFGSRIRIGEGWGTYPQFAAGDADGDGDADIWGADTSGDLYFWKGSGNGGFASRVKVGGGWNAIEPFNAMDVNGDGKADLVAVRTSDHDLFRWPGKGDGTFTSAVNIGHGWENYRPATY